MRQLPSWPFKIRHLIKGTRSRDFYSLTRYGRRTPRLRHSFLFLLVFIIPGGNIAKRLMHMASQVTESVQTSPFGGAETMHFPVPYRITTRSSASLRQPGKYTKATGGNGAWGRRCFPLIFFGAEVSVALRHFVYTYFLYTGVTDLMSAALLIQFTKYPINTTTSI